MSEKLVSCKRGREGEIFNVGWMDSSIGDVMHATVGARLATVAHHIAHHRGRDALIGSGKPGFLVKLDDGGSIQCLPGQTQPCSRQPNDADVRHSRGLQSRVLQLPRLGQVKRLGFLDWCINAAKPISDGTTFWANFNIRPRLDHAVGSREYFNVRNKMHFEKKSNSALLFVADARQGPSHPSHLGSCQGSRKHGAA